MDIRSFLEMTTFMSNLVKSSDSIHSRVAFCTTNLWTRCQTFYSRRWSPIVYLMNFPRRVLYEWPDTYLNKQWSPQWSVFLQKLIIFTATTRCRPERLLWPSVPGWPGPSINQCGPGAQPTVTTWTSRGSQPCSEITSTLHTTLSWVSRLETLTWTPATSAPQMWRTWGECCQRSSSSRASWHSWRSSLRPSTTYRCSRQNWKWKWRKAWRREWNKPLESIFLCLGPENTCSFVNLLFKVVEIIMVNKLYFINDLVSICNV